MSRPGSGRRRLLVVGNGMATDRLLDELEARGGLEALDVTVVGEEPHGAYNRILLTKVLGGAPAGSIITKPPGWYPARGVTYVRARRVQRLDVRARQAHVGNDETIGYDVAVLATGSAPVLPPVAGIRDRHGHRQAGIHVLRNLDDCLGLRAQLEAGREPSRVAVVGGGLLGLEAAKALADAGHRPTVVHPVAHLLDAQLDETGGALVRARIEALGIAVVAGRAETVLGSAGGRSRVDAVRLEDGRVLPADAVVFATGTRPRVDVAVASGIETNHGVVVDDRLATSAPGVFALGECAEHRQTTVGFVAPCWDQAAVLADVLTDADATAHYAGSTVYARLKVAGVDVASLGLVEPEPGDEVVQVLERRRGVYRKLVVRDSQLVGAALVGDAAAAPELIRLLDRGSPVPDNPLDLLCSADAYRSGGVAGDLLCTCNRVSEAAVVQAIDAGQRSVEQVGTVTRAGTGCGSCQSSIRRLLERQTAAA